MSCYGSLAGYYDKLTGDVPYSKFIEFYEAEFARDGGEFRLLLDLCCGTGTLTCELARRGYEMIAADASVDMLMQAREKSAELPLPAAVSVSGRGGARPVRHRRRRGLLARRDKLHLP